MMLIIIIQCNDDNDDNDDDVDVGQMLLFDNDSKNNKIKLK